MTPAAVLARRAVRWVEGYRTCPVCAVEVPPGTGSADPVEGVVCCSPAHAAVQAEARAV